MFEVDIERPHPEGVSPLDYGPAYELPGFYPKTVR